MTEKFKNRYRTTSHRLPGWDYGWNGYYFITLVTQNRVCNLGKIVEQPNGNKTMVLSDFGKIIHGEWNTSFEIRDELICDEYIIMPNHLHAIIVLEKPMDTTEPTTTTVQTIPHVPTTTTVQTIPHVPTTTTVETHGRASLQMNDKRQLVERKPKSISSFMGGFKSAINSKIDNYIDENNLNVPKYNKDNHFFQPNYYDRVIRNNTEYQRIKNYIITNPQKWADDRFYSTKPL